MWHGLRRLKSGSGSGPVACGLSHHQCRCKDHSSTQPHVPSCRRRASSSKWNCNLMNYGPPHEQFVTARIWKEEEEEYELMCLLKTSDFTQPSRTNVRSRRVTKIARGTKTSESLNVTIFVDRFNMLMLSFCDYLSRDWWVMYILPPSSIEIHFVSVIWSGTRAISADMRWVATWVERRCSEVTLTRLMKTDDDGRPHLIGPWMTNEWGAVVEQHAVQFPNYISSRWVAIFSSEC